MSFVPQPRSVSCLACSLGLAGALASSACVVEALEAEGGELEPDREGVIASALRWELGWAKQTLAPWQASTALGYEVEVRGAWLGTWGASLIACEEGAEASQTQLQARAPALARGPGLDLASPWIVARGHPGDSDPSGALFDRAEALGELAEDASVEPEWIELEPTAYCEAHFVFVPISASSAGYEDAALALAELDEELELAGASLLIVGTWRSPAQPDPTPFVLRSEEAYGRVVPLELEGIEPGDAHELLHLELRRGLEGLFDDIDFAAPAGDPSWTVLGSLARATRVLARPGEG